MFRTNANFQLNTQKVTDFLAVTFSHRDSVEASGNAEPSGIASTSRASSDTVSISDNDFSDKEPEYIPVPDGDGDSTSDGIDATPRK